MKIRRLILLFVPLLVFLVSFPTKVVFGKEEIELPLAYPGAVAREKVPYQYIWSDEPEALPCLTIRYDVEVLSPVVAKWYFEKLTQAGWKYEGEFDEQEYIHHFSKDKKEIKIILHPGGPNVIGIPQNGSLIHFSWRGEEPKAFTTMVPTNDSEIPIYPGAKRFYTKEIISLNKSIAAWPESLCISKTYTVANVSDETVSKWYYDTLTSSGWQFGKTKKDYVWEPIKYTSINPHFYLKSGQVLQFFFSSGGNPPLTTFKFCLSQIPKERITPPSSSTPEEQEAATSTTTTVNEDEMDLQTLISNYYYFRHKANQKRGFNYWHWSLKAIFPVQVKALEKLWNIINNPSDIFDEITGVSEIKEGIKEAEELYNDFQEAKTRGNMDVGACRTATFAASKAKIGGSLGAILLAGTYGECLMDKARDYYHRASEKLEAEEPLYCVFKEVYDGEEYCYKSWLEYWKAFHPPVIFRELSAVPRGLEKYNQAALRWQEQTKFGEFSDGKKYTVKEMAGSEWTDAFEDEGWVPEKYEIILFKGEKKTEVTPTLSDKPTPTSLPKARIVENKKVYLGDKLLLDIKDYEPGCSEFYKIDYSSTNDYFYVLLGCFENDDRLFLFKADGNDEKEVTGEWDVANNGIVNWDPDGKSFVYHRINSCCVEPERFGEKGPPEGMVRYVIATGEKTLVGQYRPPTTIPTVSPKTGPGKITTVSEFEKLPSGTGNLLSMEIKIAVNQGLGEGDTHLYEGKDKTGTVKIITWEKTLTVGKTYLLKGIKKDWGGAPPYVTVFLVRDDELPDAVTEK